MDLMRFAGFLAVTEGVSGSQFGRDVSFQYLNRGKPCLSDVKISHGPPRQGRVSSKKTPFQFHLVKDCEDRSFELRMASSSIEDRINDRVGALAAKIVSMQYEEDKSYFPSKGPPFPPIVCSHERGLFGCDIKIKLPNDRFGTVTRRISIPDSNGFATIFITQFLLESIELMPQISLPSRTVESAISAILNHRDKNQHPKDLYKNPRFSFWTQRKKEGHYISWPTNLAEPLSQLNDFATLLKDSPMMGKDHDALNSALLGPAEGVRTFGIPADADDTSKAHELGSYLLSRGIKYSRAATHWRISGGRFPVEALAKYAYRPFSSDRQENTIDPRTYFWLRGFLDQKKEKGSCLDKSSVILPTTWLQNMAESGHYWKKGESMPGGVNNIDASVATNVLLGLTAAIQQNSLGSNHIDLPDWMSPDIQKMYSDTADMLSWMIEDQLMEDDEKARSILLYYPSKIDFYYFMSRLSHALENFNDVNHFPSFMEKSKNRMTQAMRDQGTQYLLSRVIVKDGTMYWEEKLAHRDDRLFTTAAAVNALLDIWTETKVTSSRSVKEKVNKVSRSWIKGTPLEVVKAVEKAGLFLLDSGNPDRSELKPNNVFFSASFHAGLPMARAHNIHEYSDGEEIKPGGDLPMAIKEGKSYTHGISGYVSPEEYQKLQMEADAFYPSLKKKTDANEDPFSVYWSSPGVTYSFMMLALAKIYSISKQ